VYYKIKTKKKSIHELVKLRKLVDIADVIFLIINAQQKVVFINKKGCKILGFRRNEIIGKNWFENFLPEKFREKVKEIFKSLISGEIKEFEFFENPILTKSGKEKIIAWQNTILKDSSGKIIGILSSGMDITERKHTEEKLKKSQQNLRRLISHLQSVREEERTIIAQDIHDHLGQNLTALKMDLFWIEKRLPRNLKSIKEKIETMKVLIDSSFQIIKEISTRLRPSLLDDLGLIEAIKWQIEEFQNRTGIKCEFLTPLEDISLDKNQSIALFRIFQEILRNIARHAHATKVKVSFKKKDNNLELKVKDNGIGIPKEKINDPKSLGIIGMQERVDFLRGNLTIKGVKEKGTTIIINIPLK
jgi:PAS domain S-box-containing protein